MQIMDRLKDKTILLVEDETIIRENLASMLGFFFKEVYTAVDGYDGLDRYEAYLPDIVMTDLKMPNMSGFELIGELQKRSSSAFTVIVSAHTDTELLIDAIHNGIDRYLIKPVTDDELLNVFEAYIKRLDDTMPQTMKLDKEIEFFPDQNQLRMHHQILSLNKKEAKLLKLFCSDSEKVYSYEEIEYRIWGSRSMSLPAIRSVVRDLRKKIGPHYIANVSGVGYKFRMSS